MHTRIELTCGDISLNIIPDAAAAFIRTFQSSFSHTNKKPMKILQVISVVIPFTGLLTLCSEAMTFKEQCIYWHNYFRTLHQVQNVTWSMSLQKEAEDWVKYLAENNKFHHSRKNPGNLYLSAYKPKEYCTDAIQWFHWEEKFYNYSNPKFYKAAGHFTQLIWMNSKEIGAAWAIRKDKRLVISIKYRTGGNFIGYFRKNVKPPTAAILPNWPHTPPKFTRCPIGTTPEPTPQPTTTATPAKPYTGAFRDQCLYWHNYFRALHEVPFVTWSLSLEKEAKDWVKYLADNNKLEFKNNSGNLYLSTEEPREYCSQAIWWFHSQERYYDYINPRYVKAARNFTQLIWKSTKQIGAAWAIRKDGKLIVAIMYDLDGGNEKGNFEENVFPPIAETLGPAWLRAPPKFSRCPRGNIVTRPTNESVISTRPQVRAAARRSCISLDLFIAFVIVATYF